MTPRRPTSRVPAGSALPLAVALSGVALAVYLLLTVGVPDDRPTTRPSDDCVDRVVYHQARLRDC